MICFACKQCGTTFRRSNDEAGSLVFCACGTANRVPWESTVPEAALPAETEAAGTPELEALPADEGRARRRRRDEVPERDPAYCFNHQKVPPQHTCADCGESFCPACVVTLQGQTLCGPCKNFRLRSLQRPSRLSMPALFSLIVGLLTGPVGLFLTVLSGQAKTPALGLVGLLLPLTALALGVVGLRDIETRPHVRGRSLAISGLVTALVTGFLTVLWVSLLRNTME